MEVKLPTLSEMCLRKAATQQTNATLSSLVPTNLLYKLSSQTDSVVRREYPSKVISDLQSPWICIGDRTLSDASTTLVDFETVATTSLSPPPSRPSSPPPVPSRFIVGGSLGTDLLQFYIDSANESGSLHDERFTKEFWDYLEKSFVLSATSSASSDSSCPPNKKLKTTPTAPRPPAPALSGGGPHGPRGGGSVCCFALPCNAGSDHGGSVERRGTRGQRTRGKRRQERRQ